MKDAEFFKEKARKVQDEALDTLKGYVAINSVYDESTRSMENPFGAGVRNALDYIASVGRKLGFHYDPCDHYATELSYGEGRLLDVYAHADVVPVSKNWKTDPFTPTIIDDVMYARGCSDDKGPGTAALYGAKICMDEGLLDGVRIRLFFGGNEERDSLGLEHYFKVLKKGYPTYGFSPDANYPLIYGEKGIYTYEVTYKLDDSRIPSFSFGQATNIVLDETMLHLGDDKEIEKAFKDYLNDYPMIKGEMHDGIVHFKGKSSHGSVPQNGVNAGLHLLNFLGRLYNHSELCRIYNEYCIGDGKAFGGDFSSSYFDGTTYCVGIMNYDGKELKLLVNCRIPENITIEKVVDFVNQMTTPTSIKLLGGSKGILVDPESEFVKTLLHVYQEQTGDLESKPLTIGGGTYARETRNSVAFGMEYPGVDTKMHQDGEFLRLKDFRQSIAIYAQAIAEIAELIRKGK